MIPNNLFWRVIEEIQSTLLDYEAVHGFSPAMWDYVEMVFHAGFGAYGWQVTQIDFVAAQYP